MKIYIAGPMSGIALFNFPAFDKKRDQLLKDGYQVVSPADIDRQNGFDPIHLPEDHDWTKIPEQAGTRAEIIKRDIAELLTCDAIYLLPGWENSVGARAEASIARWSAMYITYGSGTKSPHADVISAPIKKHIERQAYEDNNETNQQALDNYWSAFTKPAATKETEIRTFASGATRNLDKNKLDFEGFLSPTALEAFAEYMHGHRQQKDGVFRDADNWQKGIPIEAYMKSMWRHFFDLWKKHRGLKATSSEDGHDISITEALCSILFNVQGYLHEHLKTEKPL